MISPVRGMTPEPVPDESQPLLDAVLAPGDFLFVPAGYWHRCENGDGLSLHVGIFLEPPSAWQAAKDLLPSLAADVAMRAPLTRFASAAERAAHDAALKARLIAAVERMPLDAVAPEEGPRP